MSTVISQCDNCRADFRKILKTTHKYNLCPSCNRERTGAMDRARLRAKRHSMPAEERRALMPLRTCVECGDPFASPEKRELCCGCVLKHDAPMMFTIAHPLADLRRMFRGWS